MVSIAEGQTNKNRTIFIISDISMPSMRRNTLLETDAEWLFYQCLLIGNCLHSGKHSNARSYSMTILLVCTVVYPWYCSSGQWQWGVKSSFFVPPARHGEVQESNQTSPLQPDSHWHSLHLYDGATFLVEGMFIWPRAALVPLGVVRDCHFHAGRRSRVLLLSQVWQRRKFLPKNRHTAL